MRPRYVLDVVAKETVLLCRESKSGRTAINHEKPHSDESWQIFVPKIFETQGKNAWHPAATFGPGPEFVQRAL
jgi:hypothetical protein